MICTHWWGPGLLPPSYSSKGIPASERTGVGCQMQPTLWPAEGQGLLSPTILLQLTCVVSVHKCVQVSVPVCA